MLCEVCMKYTFHNNKIPQIFYITLKCHAQNVKAHSQIRSGYYCKQLIATQLIFLYFVGLIPNMHNRYYSHNVPDVNETCIADITLIM